MIEKEIQVKSIQKDIEDIEKKINDSFSKKLVSHIVPDRMPTRWCKSKLRINIPYDMINIKELKEVFFELENMVTERSKLRESEAKLLLSIGMIDHKETMPD